MLKAILQEITRRKINNLEELEALKKEMAFKFKKSSYPSNFQLLSFYHNLLKKKEISPLPELEKLLVTRPVRALSGVVVITVLTKPYPCPGKCLYCPNERNMPKSYLLKEPACQRAASSEFNPFHQVKNRIEVLENCGHPAEKIDLVVLGGTWSAYPRRYQTWFIKRCFEACNQKTAHSLTQAKKLNEKSSHRIIGLTLETRPDFITVEEVKRMRFLGCTRVELGVQSIDDEILKLNQRGHSVKTIIQATQLLKDAGFKVNYHLMLNLYGSSPQRDEKMFEKIFQDPCFRPDYLKIYPCVVLKSAPLFKLYQEKKYQPYSQKVLLNLLTKIKQKIPYWIRVQRIIRDIPSFYIVAGNKTTNLREIIQEEMKKKGLKCHCIRCRQATFLEKNKLNLKLFREDYWASNGKEIFLSYEDKNRKKLYAFLRLRIPSFYFSGQNHFLKVLNGAGIIREIHTYGQVARIGQKETKSPQHKGLGKKLIALAEKITKKEFGLSKIAVISGVGVREYYRKLGYRLKDEYMIKNLN